MSFELDFEHFWALMFSNFWTIAEAAVPKTLFIIIWLDKQLHDSFTAQRTAI